MSGKAKCDAVPPARTAIQEATLLVESEGHVARVCGLLVHMEEALARPKPEVDVIGVTVADKWLRASELSGNRTRAMGCDGIPRPTRSAEQCILGARPCQTARTRLQAWVLARAAGTRVAQRRRYSRGRGVRGYKKLSAGIAPGA